MSIELTEDECWALLDDKMVMRLATVDSNGRPHVVPIWYLSHRELGNIYFSTPADTQKANNIGRMPHISLTVDEGAFYFQLRAVIIEGTASIVDSENERAIVEEKWCQKYFGESTRPEFMDLLYQGRSWEWYRVEPSQWISWDNTKINLERLRKAHK